MYYKDVNYKSNKAMYEFLVNHFTYDTMNSWNRLKSIANNVKLYNLPGIDVQEALEALERDDYFSINETIRDWEADHPGYKVGFNGRSGGYLVLYNNYNNEHCFKSDMWYVGDYVSYEAWKEDVKRGYGTLKDYQPNLIEEVKIVQEFDKLCDDLIEVLKEMIVNMRDEKARTHSYSATLRFQRYYYDTLEDLKLHMLDMKRRGYSVYEYSQEDLYAEYEMNEAINSEVVLEQEGDEDFVYD